jgi:hypothetical protein
MLHFCTKGVYTHRNYICSLLQVFFIITCSFSMFVGNCILLPKGLNEFVVFLCIVHVWFWFFILLPRFVLLSHKGTFFSQNKISVSECIIIFRYKNVASKSFYQNKIHPFSNTTNSFKPLGSNIQFPTNTEKEQVIIKKTCNNEQI